MLFVPPEICTLGVILGHIPLSLRRSDWESSAWTDGQYWLLHVKIICYAGAYFSPWRDGYFYALYLWFPILHRELAHPWLVITFVASSPLDLSILFRILIICDIIISFMWLCFRLYRSHQVPCRKHRWIP